MADTDPTEAYRLGTDAMHKLRYQDGPDGYPMLVAGSNEDCARTVVDAVAELLIEQGRKLGYDQAAEDMTPLVQAGHETGRRDALDEILSHDDGGHDWSVPDVVLLARGGEQAVDEANDPAKEPGADG